MKVKIAASLLCISFAGTGIAGTYKSWKVSDYKSYSSYVKLGTYKLGGLVTKEFRFACDVGLALESRFENDIKITNIPKNVTCTIDMINDYAHPPYDSQSCTNWDPFNSKTVTIWGKCPMK